MSAQPARMARADLRHVAVTPLVRTAGAARAGSSRAGTVSRTPRRATTSPARPVTSPARPATSPGRPATQAVRTAAPAAAWVVLDQRVRSRLGPAAVTLAVILVGTMLGLVYLTQTLAAAGARYKVDTLLVEREALMRTLKSQEGTIAGWNLRRGSASGHSRRALTGWVPAFLCERADPCLVAPITTPGWHC